MAQTNTHSVFLPSDVVCHHMSSLQTSPHEHKSVCDGSFCERAALL